MVYVIHKVEMTRSIKYYSPASNGVVSITITKCLAIFRWGSECGLWGAIYDTITSSTVRRYQFKLDRSNLLLVTKFKFNYNE